jgi:hypothetical protein
MVEASPTAAFEMAQSKFLFQLLVVPFNQPALLRNLNEVLQLGFRRKRGEPILGGLRFVLGLLHK